MLGVGEGGALCTDYDEVAERVRRLRSQGMIGEHDRPPPRRRDGYDVDELGYNYRFDEPRAALLLLAASPASSGESSSAGGS